ncbi:hypothetical protein ACP4OV_024531 [Aristida adscensionis]
MVALWNEQVTAFEADNIMAMSQQGPVVILFVGMTVGWFNGDPPSRRAVHSGIPARLPVGARLRAPSPSCLRLIIHTSSFMKRFIVSTVIKEIVRKQPWWFVACERCRKAAVPQGSIYRFTGPCCSCTTARPRYRLVVLAADPYPPSEDEGRVIEFVFFSPTAEEVIGVPVHTLLATLGGDAAPLPPEIARLCGRELKLRVSVSLLSLQQDFSFQVDSIVSVARPHGHLGAGGTSSSASHPVADILATDIPAPVSGHASPQPAERAVGSPADPVTPAPESKEPPHQKHSRNNTPPPTPGTSTPSEAAPATKESGSRGLLDPLDAASARPNTFRASRP